MRAREADADGFVEHRGVKIHYEVYGAGEVTLVLMPTWTIIHKRFWKGQIPYLARHFRVVVYDGPGNGRSDRPEDSAAYHQDAQVAYALKVLDATGTDQAVLVGVSKAANWILDLAANHGERVRGAVLIGPSVSVVSYSGARGAEPGAPPPDEPSRVPLVQPDPPAHWAKFNPAYWRDNFDDFLWFFLGQCFSEPRSTKQIEDGVGWGRETNAAVLAADTAADRPDAETLAEWCSRIGCPLLLIHGDDDRVSPPRRSQVLADLTGADLVTLHGAGHVPPARDPVKINLLLRDFVERLGPTGAASTPGGGRRAEWSRHNRRPRRVLYLSSPIGLGHARRDVAIAAALREHHPEVHIDWLAQHPVTTVLEQVGERVHPASRWLANESAHIESEAGEHDLHCFEALRRMDEVLVSNFMVFQDVVTDTDYDLVIGDEGWDVDHFLHENPELKRFAYAWLTDFVGFLPMPDGGRREHLVAADYNAEMIEHIERLPRVRDRAIFVGNPGDIVPATFGPGLPLIRDWTQQHYDFAGYVTGFDPATVADRAALRAELGYHPDEKVCVVTVGGSGVGEHLLRRVAGAFEEAARRVAGLRMVLVTGPRIDPASLGVTAAGVDVRAFVPSLHRHLAVSDLAIVQGGLTTCMELTAAGRPFLYIPLRHHFEQNFHVTHRLARYGAGRRLDYDDLTPEVLADAIAAEIGRPTAYRPVESDGAARTAQLLADLL